MLQGPSSLPVFITYDTPTKTLTYAPTLFSQVGSYTISVTLINAYISNTYTFTVVVQNFAPVFAAASSTSITVTVSLTATYSLPSYTDPDGNPMTLTTV